MFTKNPEINDIKLSGVPLNEKKEIIADTQQLANVRIEVQNCNQDITEEQSKINIAKSDLDISKNLLDRANSEFELAKSRDISSEIVAKGKKVSEARFNVKVSEKKLELEKEKLEYLKKKLKALLKKQKWAKAVLEYAKAKVAYKYENLSPDEKALKLTDFEVTVADKKLDWIKAEKDLAAEKINLVKIQQEYNDLTK